MGRLRLGPIEILHLPGELFVEYQLAAQKLRPDSFVCVAAYGDYGPGYIGTAEAYCARRLRNGRRLACLARLARAEAVLMTAIGELLE